MNRKERDPLDVLKRAVRKLQRVGGDVDGALERREALRLLELQALLSEVKALETRLERAMATLRGPGSEVGDAR